MPNASGLLDRKGRDIATIAPSATVLDAAKAMNERRIGSLVVTDDADGSEVGKVVGMLSERDILTRVVAMGRAPDKTTVRTVMTPDVITAEGDTPLDDIRAVMREKRIRHVPVLESGRLTGMVSIGDLNAEARQSLTEQITTLEGYIRQG